MSISSNDRSYVIKTLSDKEVRFSLIDDQQFDNLKTQGLQRLDDHLSVDHKPTFKLDKRIIHRYFIDRKERYHVFESYDDYLNFFDTTNTKQGPALDYTPGYKLIYFYDLKARLVRDLFKDTSNAEVLFTYPDNLYKVYSLKGRHGAFMVQNNGHFNQAFWYPDYESFKIDYEFFKKLE